LYFVYTDVEYFSVTAKSAA